MKWRARSECPSCALAAGDRDVHHGETEEEILPETAGCDISRQIAVGCRDDADIDGHFPLGTNRTDAPFFQRPQQLRLHGERKIGDFVEKQRTAVRIEEQGRYATPSRR